VAKRLIAYYYADEQEISYQNFKDLSRSEQSRIQRATQIKAQGFVTANAKKYPGKRVDWKHENDACVVYVYD